MRSHTKLVADRGRQRRAVAFSVAGLPLLRRDRSSFSDDGVRYEFLIDDGRVLLVGDDGRGSEFSSTFLTTKSTRAPRPPDHPLRFSMVAASGGRVFAKVEGQLGFWVASMESADLYLDAEHGKEIEINDGRFTLDPEHNRDGAKVEDLVGPLLEHSGHHPFAERNRILAELLRCNGLGFMMAFMKPRVWQWLDARPPLLTFDHAMQVRNLTRLNPFTLFTTLVHLGAPGTIDLHRMGQLGRDLLSEAPGQETIGGLGTHVLTEYERQPRGMGEQEPPPLQVLATRGINVCEVLSIGVGHVHLHEQYERRYGGELQPLQARNALAQNERLYAAGYRMFNGPVRDYDGFIDGTCNYYMLCRVVPAGGTFESSPETYRILWIDEQTFFPRRWRLLHPVKNPDGMMFSLVNDLKASPWIYDFDPKTYWCPLEAGCIGSGSRMAVSREVILLTGQDRTLGRPELYSINFSWASCDRTWRWRTYPDGAAVLSLANDDDPVDERLAPAGNAQAAVFPQTVRLREDMTIAIKGLKRMGEKWVAGRWIQKYLPASNLHVPETPEPPPAPPKPATGYTHPWDFLSEPAFALADRFTHLGVYQRVNSRSQFYRIGLLPDVERVLRSPGRDEQADVWIAPPGSLYINMVRVNWHPTIKNGQIKIDDLVNTAGPPPRQATSMYELVGFRFKLLDRGEAGWIAVFADKRDDDLEEFSDLPKRATLFRASNPDEKIDVTFQQSVLAHDSPVVELATMVLARGQDGRTEANLTLKIPLTPLALLENLWCVRAGAFVGGEAKVLWSVPRSDLARVGDDHYHAIIRGLSDADAALLTEAARQQFATNIWFEDIVGHVAPPERLVLPATFP